MLAFHSLTSKVCAWHQWTLRRELRTVKGRKETSEARALCDGHLRRLSPWDLLSMILVKDMNAFLKLETWVVVNRPCSCVTFRYADMGLFQQCIKKKVEFYVYSSFACLYVCEPCICLVTLGSQEWPGMPWTWVTQCRCWELALGPLQTDKCS